MSSIKRHGPWSVSLQPQSPLHWLRTESEDNGQYVMALRITSQEVNKKFAAGVSLHDGELAIWVESSRGRKVYCVGGPGLVSMPVVTQGYTFSKDQCGKKVLNDEWEIHLQGNYGYAFVNNHATRVNFWLKSKAGRIGFFNTSPSDSVLFHNVTLDEFYQTNVPAVDESMPRQFFCASRKPTLPGIGIPGRKALAVHKEKLRTDTIGPPGQTLARVRPPTDNSADDSSSRDDQYVIT